MLHGGLHRKARCACSSGLGFELLWPRRATTTWFTHWAGLRRLAEPQSPRPLPIPMAALPRLRPPDLPARWVPRIYSSALSAMPARVGCQPSLGTRGPRNFDWENLPGQALRRVLYPLHSTFSVSCWPASALLVQRSFISRI